MTAGADARAFVMALYAVAGVSEACLRLQDRRGLNVVLLLFAAFLGEKGIAMSDEAIAAAAHDAAAWHADVVAPLRGVRRRLKHGPPPASTPETEELRRKVQAVEVAAELLELAHLETRARDWPRTGAQAGGDLAARNMRAVVAAWMQEALSADDSRDVAMIAAATARPT